MIEKRYYEEVNLNMILRHKFHLIDRVVLVLINLNQSKNYPLLMPIIFELFVRGRGRERESGRERGNTERYQIRGMEVSKICCKIGLGKKLQRRLKR